MQSCQDLKNFAAVFAIMEGLMHPEVHKQESAWRVNIRIDIDIISALGSLDLICHHNYT